MFRKILPLIILSFGLQVQAQNIQNISYLPPFPGPLDSVKVIVDLVFTSGSCDIQFENHSVNNDSIRINVFHCPGALTVICYVTDTINLGLLNPGSFDAEVIVHTSSWSTPDPCTDINPTDSGSIQITVLPSSGIKESVEKKNSIIFHQQSKSIMLENYNEIGASILVFDVLGKMIIDGKFDQSNRIILPKVNEGLYLYLLRTNDAALSSGKFIVH